MPLFPPQWFRKARGIIRRGTRAAQPLATNVLPGTIYYVTDETLLERSNGTTWQSYSGAIVPSIFVSTATGNIDDLNFGNADVIWMNNASDATIRGLVAGVNGQRVIIHSIGAGHVFNAHQNTNSAANNRLINDITIGNTPLAAGFGSAVYIYDTTGAVNRWRLDRHYQGKWITPTFSAGDYFASGATTTWTVASGDVVNFQYFVTGNKLEINFNISGSTITSTSTTQLIRNLPNGFQCDKGTQIVVVVVDNGVVGAGRVRVTASATTMDWFNAVGTPSAWANSTDNTGFVGYIPISLL